MTTLLTNEVLRVTPTGEFVWHEDADRMIEEGDFSASPATQHILRALRKQRTWVGLTDKEIDELWMSHHDDFGNSLSATSYERAIEAKLKEKNCG